jgi:Vacuole effluxer Atg22 like
MIGPNVVQAIIDRTHINQMGFAFLFAMCVCANLVIWIGVDVPTGRRDAVAWANTIRENSKSEEEKEKQI